MEQRDRRAALPAAPLTRQPRHPFPEALTLGGHPAAGRRVLLAGSVCHRRRPDPRHDHDNLHGHVPSHRLARSSPESGACREADVGGYRQLPWRRLRHGSHRGFLSSAETDYPGRRRGLPGCRGQQEPYDALWGPAMPSSRIRTATLWESCAPSILPVVPAPPFRDRADRCCRGYCRFSGS